jgi:hypothetical protein
VAKFFICLDLKDTFLCILLVLQSQPIFAFQWKNPSTGEKEQLTWTHRHKVSKVHPLFSELFWHPTSKFSQPTSMAAHSSSMKMTSCWLDQLGRTIWKGLTSILLFYAVILYLRMQSLSEKGPDLPKHHQIHWLSPVTGTVQAWPRPQVPLAS